MSSDDAHNQAMLDLGAKLQTAANPIGDPWAETFDYDYRPKTILHQIGEGGFGRVSAITALTKKGQERKRRSGMEDFVVKEIIPRRDDQSDAGWKRQRVRAQTALAEEMEMLAYLRLHQAAHVVRIEAVVKIDGFPAIVMENAGINHLGNLRTNNLTQILDIFGQVMCALIDLRKHKVFHGDIKESNIGITPLTKNHRPAKSLDAHDVHHYRAKVLDLGGAQFTDDDGNVPGIKIHTEGYIDRMETVRLFNVANDCGEQKVSGLPYDLYASAVVMTHLLPEYFRRGVHHRYGLRTKVDVLPAELFPAYEVMMAVTSLDRKKRLDLDTVQKTEFYQEWEKNAISKPKKARSGGGGGGKIKRSSPRGAAPPPPILQPAGPGQDNGNGNGNSNGNGDEENDGNGDDQDGDGDGNGQGARNESLADASTAAPAPAATPAAIPAPVAAPAPAAAPALAATPALMAAPASTATPALAVTPVLATAPASAAAPALAEGELPANQMPGKRKTPEVGDSDGAAEVGPAPKRRRGDDGPPRPRTGADDGRNGGIGIGSGSGSSAPPRVPLLSGFWAVLDARILRQRVARRDGRLGQGVRLRRRWFAPWQAKPSSRPTQRPRQRARVQIRSASIRERQGKSGGAAGWWGWSGWWAPATGATAPPPSPLLAPSAERVRPGPPPAGQAAGGTGGGKRRRDDEAEHGSTKRPRQSAEARGAAGGTGGRKRKRGAGGQPAPAKKRRQLVKAGGAAGSGGGGASRARSTTAAGAPGGAWLARGAAPGQMLAAIPEGDEEVGDGKAKGRARGGGTGAGGGGGARGGAGGTGNGS